MSQWNFSGPNDKYVTEEDAFEHIDGLVARFKESPEFQAYTQAQDGDPGGNVRLILELGWQYDGLLPSHCEFQDFQDTLLSLFPRKVSCPPEEAKLIVAELRAYLAFAQREFGYRAAKECLEKLTPEFTELFEQRMGDRSLFGMAKSFLSGAREAGFDMSTEEGRQQAIMAQNLGRLSAPRREFTASQIRLVDTPLTQEPDRSGKRKNRKKNTRKMQKKSRRKNR